jgi:nucleotide-binding universal stress UspA family protein
VPLKILCPIDFSEISELLLRKTHDLAASMGAELYLIHIIPSSAQQVQSKMDAEPKQLWFARHNAKKKLHSLAKKYVPPGIKTHVLVRQGDITTELQNIGCGPKSVILRM